MLLKYLNSNRISLIWLISLFPILYWVPSVFQAGNIQLAEPSGVPLGRLVMAFNRDFRIIASILALILVIVNGYLLIQLNTVHIFIPGRTQLPSFFYLLPVISMTELHQLTPHLLVSSLMILVFFRILGTYKTENISLNFLDAGLLISLASLFFLPALAFFLFLLATLVILRPFIWREWTYAFLGLVIPYLFLASIYYLAGIPLNNYFSDVTASLQKSEHHVLIRQMINWSYIAVMLIVGSVYLIGAIDSMKIHARKFFIVFLMYFLCSVLIYLLIPGAGTGMIYFASVPMAYLFSHYFMKCKRTWLNDLLLLISLLLLLWQRI